MPKKLEMEELNRLSVDEFKHAKKFPIVVILDNIRSLSNVGSVFRTSDAFRIESVYLCGITATPPHREIHKTALSATESVDWKYFKTTIEAVNFLKNDGYKIISVEQVENSTKLHDLQVDKNCNCALIFGNEVKGVDNDIIAISDCCVEIPQWGTKHSLNISVSVGIVLWDMVLKLK
ncbi:MAG: RNA methyltransferase [Lentimicrobiaceae bacterium]|jgi:23S rRNA (guanosine2251-2'-O)-methyltransferase|nr:RNA methyltransferase [Lentimicrobiaceae bacterium]MDG1901755.1 RNA methyltransferase [Bacteroidales bacterium]MDG2081323.1 RNA methyltransferase [Bacteroidales bacterium]|tara:strand:+ start:361 stop:891 length:531 start_codon:yes stop_codon:yes gene_type:complete